MRLSKKLLVPLLLAAAIGIVRSEPVDAQKVLAASDAIRNPDKSFVLDAALIEYRGGKQVDGNMLAIYSSPDAPGGAYRTLVWFAEPARDAGKLMLKNGTELWFFDPANQATIRISPDQRLLGQAANGDVATANFAHDYHAALEAEEDVVDGDRQSRHCQRLALTAATNGVTYHHIQIWIDASTHAPIKAKFYAENDRLLKTAFYRHFKDELGASRPTETVIIDGLDPGWVTVMRFSNYRWRSIPEGWLQRDYLPRFKPE